MYWDIKLEDRYIKYKINNDISWLDAITFVNIGIDNPRYSNICEIEKPEALDVWVDKYRNLPANYIPNDLKKVKKQYCNRSLELRNEACEVFEAMCDATFEDGIRLIAISAFRDYEYQEKVYYRYYTKKIAEAGIWIAKNCVNYGFILRYPKDKEQITGYKYEP